MTTLLALGYLEQGARRKYRLSSGCDRLGMAAMNSTGLREHSHAYLEELRQRTSYTASLAVLDGIGDRVCRSGRELQSRTGDDRPGLQPGSRLPAYCTSMGKVLLASLSEKERRERISESQLTKHGPTRS